MYLEFTGGSIMSTYYTDKNITLLTLALKKLKESEEEMSHYREKMKAGLAAAENGRQELMQEIESEGRWGRHRIFNLRTEDNFRMSEKNEEALLFTNRLLFLFEAFGARLVMKNYFGSIHTEAWQDGPLVRLELLERMGFEENNFIFTLKLPFLYETICFRFPVEPKQPLDSILPDIMFLYQAILFAAGKDECDYHFEDQVGNLSDFFPI